MALIGKISVGLAARTAKFEAGMKRSRKSVKGFAATLIRAKAAAMAFGVVVTGVVVAGMTVLVKRSFKAIDATAKLAGRIGETTENLIGLQHAAGITGAGADKLSAAIDVLQKRLGEAKMGMGEGKAALETLNLTVEDLLKLRPADQFKLIADRVSGLSTAAEKAAITSKLFSRANQDLVNMLDLGAKGIEKLMLEAEELGMTYSRIDAAKIEEANDAILKMEGAFQGMGNALAIVIAPSVTTITEKITSWAASISKARKEAEKWRTFGDRIQAMRDKRRELRKKPKGIHAMSLDELGQQALAGKISAEDYVQAVVRKYDPGAPKRLQKVPAAPGAGQGPGREQAAWISKTMAAQRRSDTFLHLLQSAAMSEKASIEGRMPWPAGAGFQQRQAERTALGARVGGPSREQGVKDREAIAKLDEVIAAIKAMKIPAVAA